MINLGPMRTIILLRAINLYTRPFNLSWTLKNPTEPTLLVLRALHALRDLEDVYEYRSDTNPTPMWFSKTTTVTMMYRTSIMKTSL